MLPNLRVTVILLLVAMSDILVINILLISQDLTIEDLPEAQIIRKLDDNSNFLLTSVEMSQIIKFVEN